MRKLIPGLVALVVILGTDRVTRGEENAPQAVVDRAIKALGTAAGDKRAATWKGKGKFMGLGQEIEFAGEWFVQLPSQLKAQMEFDFMGNKVTRTQVLDGDKGWVSMMGNTDDMSADDLAQSKDQLYTQWVATIRPLKDPAFKLTPLGESKVGDRAVVGLKVSHAGHPDVSLYFDKETGLLAKSTQKVKDMEGQEVEQDTYPSDYGDVDGGKHARKQTIKRGGKDFVTMEITDFKREDKLPPGTFAKPGQ